MNNTPLASRRRHFVWLTCFALLLTGCSTHLKFLVIDADTGSPLKNVAVTQIYRRSVYAPLLIIPAMVGGDLRTNRCGPTNERGVVNLWFGGQRTRTFEFVAQGYRSTNVFVGSEVTDGGGCLLWSPVLADTRSLDAFGDLPIPKNAIAGPTVLTNGFVLVPLVPWTTQLP